MLWHGSVCAQGFVFDEQFVSRATIAQRLIRWWSPQARVGRYGTRWYLLGVGARWVDSRVSEGAPLVYLENRWLAGPLTPDELVSHVPETVIDWVDGARVAISPPQLENVHPAMLVSLEPPRVLEVLTLAPASSAPSRAAAAPTVDSVFAHMLDALPPAPPRPRPATIAERLRRFFGEPVPEREGVDTAPRPDPVPAEPHTPNWFARTWAEWTKGRREAEQAAYLEDLRATFARGDLREALHRAIPLGGAASATARSTSVPQRRSELPLLAPKVAVASSLVMQNDEFAAMKALYKQAADALVEQGKIEEAAYLFAKLLNDAAAGVALLEKHRKFELAAKLATAERLPAVERLRLWLLAGHYTQALRIARSSQDFELLANALKAKAPSLENSLRAHWGGFLAQHQRYAEALVATSQLPEAPSDWSQWVERALDGSPEAGATALAVDCARFASNASEHRHALSQMLERATGPEAIAAARAFLTHAPRAARAIHRDNFRRLASLNGVDRTLLDRVLQASHDAALVADSTILAPRAPPTQVAEYAPPGLEATAALDAALLPKGRLAVALGAAGLRISDAGGKELKHHLVKADALVAGPIGVPILVLSKDGALTHVWKLDPRHLTLTSWFQAQLGEVALRYDGLGWAVSMGTELVFLDPAAASPMEWWRLPNLTISHLDATGPHILALCEAAENPVWKTVRTDTLETHSRGTSRLWVKDNKIIEWDLHAHDQGRWELAVGRARTRLELGHWRASCCEAHLVLTRVQEQGIELWASSWNSPVDLHVVARLPGVFQPRVRVCEQRVLVADEAGRVTEVMLDALT